MLPPPFGSIKIRYPDGTDDSYEIVDKTVWVGSASHNNLYLDDESVSRQHARLEVTGDGMTLQDLGSAEGTFVHGQRLEVGDERVLTGHEPIRFGDVEVRYTPAERADTEVSSEPPDVPQEPAPAPAPAPAPEPPPAAAAPESEASPAVLPVPPPDAAASDGEAPREPAPEPPPEPPPTAADEGDEPRDPPPDTAADPGDAPQDPPPETAVADAALPVPPAVVIAAPRREPPLVRVSGPSSPVTPGDSAHAEVAVVNGSDVVEEYRLSVRGLHADWFTLPQDRIEIAPHSEITLPMVVHPPRSPETTPGDVAFAVEAAPGTTGVQGATAGGVLRVLPYYEASVALSPPASQRDFGVVVRNLGNERQEYELSAEDSTRELEFRLGATTLALAPGQETTLPMRVAAAAGAGREAWGVQEFTVRARPQETQAPEALVKGRLVLSKDRTWWKLVGVAVVALLGLAVVAALYAAVACPGRGLPLCPSSDQPVIEVFQARTETGAEALKGGRLSTAPGELVLVWWVVGAPGGAHVELAEDGGETLTGLELADRVAKYPMWTTTYTLRAVGDDGRTSEESLTVEVSP